MQKQRCSTNRHMSIQVYNKCITSYLRMSTVPPNQATSFLLDALFSADAFDFWSRKVHPLWSCKKPLAQIISKHPESEDAVTLVLKPNRHVSAFIAGQHVNVSVEIDGRQHSRSYSPRYLANNQIAITVKRIEGGKVSTWLCNQSQRGDIVQLNAPFGEMTLKENPSHAIFLAAGSGITPFLSLIQAHAKTGQRITLLYWVRDDASTCFAEALTRLEQANPAFRLHLLMTRPKEGNASGRIHLAQIQALVPDLVHTHWYACGPEGFVSTAAGLAKQFSRPFLGEAFSLPELATSPGEHVQIHLLKSRKTISVPSGEPLLSALENAGIQPAHGCRRGICNTCACPKSSGTTRNILTQEEQHEAVSGLRLCISAACSDLTLDL